MTDDHDRLLDHLLARRAMTADEYRREFDRLRREAVDAELCGNEGLAHTLRVEASDCLILAADIERAERGLPPLSPVGP